MKYGWGEGTKPTHPGEPAGDLQSLPLLYIQGPTGLGRRRVSVWQ